MGKLLNIITSLHRQTRRDYIGRMVDEKISCMQKARKYDRDFWDGDRRYGYGGYSYDGRWAKAAGQLVEYYNLSPDARILDVGCGKGYLLYELKKYLPQSEVTGFDISGYAIEKSHPEVRNFLFNHPAQAIYPFEDNYFDLVISLTTLHNLVIYELKQAISEIQRVGKNRYITMESYRNESELFNLQCWALTCEAFYRPEEWIWLFDTFGYSGDYEFIYFE